MHQLKIFKALSAGALLLCCASGAQAALIKTALSVVIDGSGSISSTDFQLQKDAYASVFGDSSVLKADGSVVINVIQFSGSTLLEFSARRIENATDRSDLVAAMTNMTQLNGSTAIGDGINAGASNMDIFLSTITATELDPEFTKLIDVSTDGNNNSGADPATESQNAINDGYSVVNCLGIGAGADCGWNDGFGADFSANSFDELEPVLERKVREELGTTPIPGTVMLLGAGLLGFGALRRRLRT
ncbi:MAG: VWA domain-containing protein [Gammaproteobacteria bacterium]|jgi:hypothetical protein|nr:VWA domain-containing protein [Gammaproteobacteria bacterium]